MMKTIPAIETRGSTLSIQFSGPLSHTLMTSLASATTPISSRSDDEAVLLERRIVPYVRRGLAARNATHKPQAHADPTTDEARNAPL